MRRIAVDARMADLSGIGRYLQSLLPRLVVAGPVAHYSLLGEPKRLEAALPGLVERANVRVIRATTPIYGVREQWELARRIPRSTDLVWSPHYNVPLACGRPLLATVHDVLHLARPEYASGLHRRLYAETLFRVLTRRAAAIICVSRFTADELMRLTGVRADRLHVIHNGIDGAWFEDAPSPVSSPWERPYLLYVGNIKPHKNLVRLVAAFEQVAPEIPHDLVLVGKREGFLTGDEEVVRAAHRLGDRVRFTGSLPDASLRRYYRYADALVFPSLYEGFGFPPLEAMASGCPVLASRAASLPEVCGDAAAYVDPFDVQDIAAQIRRVVGDAALRAELMERGLERARHFSWERSARETREVMERVAEGSGGR